MKIKYLTIISGIIISLTIASFYVKSKTQNTYARMFVTFGHNKLPYTEIQIQGKKHLMHINLDFSKFPLYLSKDILSTIDRQAQEKITTTTAVGNEIQSQVYLIPKVLMRECAFKDVLTREVDLNDPKTPAKDNTIGRSLLDKHQLLLDFGNATMIICKDKKRLQKAGYKIENMTKVPCEIGTMGIIFIADTDFGKVRFRLSTANAVSSIRLDLEGIPNNSEERSILTTSKLKMGDRDFGLQDLYCFIFPGKCDFDGCIGMDFLLNHVVYIDFEKKEAYMRSTYD